MTTITIATNTGPKEIEAEVYKGWGIHETETGFIVTHLPSGRGVATGFDEAEDPKQFIDLMEFQGVNPEASAAELAANEDFRMCLGFHASRQMMPPGHKIGDPACDCPACT